MAKEFKLFSGRVKFTVGKKEKKELNPIIMMTSDSLGEPYSIIGLISSNQGIANTPMGFLQTSKLDPMQQLELAARNVGADAVISIKQTSNGVTGTAVKFLKSLIPETPEPEQVEAETIVNANVDEVPKEIIEEK